eukprot:scaffold108180_cov21-Tisochrysis_lutea.AAC.2
MSHTHTSAFKSSSVVSRLTPHKWSSVAQPTNIWAQLRMAIPQYKEQQEEALRASVRPGPGQAQGAGLTGPTTAAATAAAAPSKAIHADIDVDSFLLGGTPGEE